ncbi:MAG: hypothetical protein Q4G45_06470 [Actinomycetia bacterium]|nr:hypothetical protein [Actinomycetes bacterium]
MRAPYVLKRLQHGGALVIHTAELTWSEVSDEAADLLESPPADRPTDPEVDEFLRTAAQMGWIEEVRAYEC